MVKFTLRQCRYFQAVAEQGGIAQAARVLNLAQPSVSQAVEKLEEVTGLILFDRHHARGLTLTLQGRQFLEQVNHLYLQASQLEQHAAALAAGSAGEIRLGMFWSLSPFIASGLVQGFAQVAPQATIRLTELSLANLAEQLRQGALDLAITYERGANNAGLRMLTLTARRPTVLLSTHHPLAKRRHVRLADLMDEPYVMFDAPGSRTYFENLLAEYGMNPPIAFSSTTLEGVRSAVAAGLGFTILVVHPPSSTTYDGGAVKIMQIKEEVRPLNIVLAAREDARSEPLLQSFTEHVSSYFASKAGSLFRG